MSNPPPRSAPPSDSPPVSSAVPPAPFAWTRPAPGLALAAATAALGWLAASALSAASGGRLALPAMVAALFVGMALHKLATRPLFQPGLTLSTKALLRVSVALLGLRLSIGDIVGLGLGAAAFAVALIVVTLASGFAFARLFGRDPVYGALAGAANAVCGASATLATAAVLPQTRDKAADVAFAVVMANVVSTLAMLAYPLTCVWLGLDARQTGLALGLTIQDMAQVVGAGYAVSPETGDAAVVVKLFRVLMLAPVVIVVGRLFAGRGASGARPPWPLFAFAFIALALVNSLAPATPAAEAYAVLRGVLLALAQGGLMLAIAALGLATSVKGLAAKGWRHAAVFCGAALVALLVGLAGAILAG